MKNPIFYKTVSTKTVTVGQRHLRNHNKLLWQLDGAEGVKTGYTKAAGRILVSSATRQGRRLIAVTINAPDDWQDHKQLMEKGFSQYAMTQILRKGQIMGYAQVVGGESGSIPLISAEGFCYPLSAQEKTEIVLPAPGFVYAPVAEGQEAGFAHVCVDGHPVGKIPLYYGETIERVATQEEAPFWRRIFGGKAA